MGQIIDIGTQRETETFPCIECGRPHLGIPHLMCEKCWGFWSSRMVLKKPSRKIQGKVVVEGNAGSGGSWFQDLFVSLAAVCIVVQVGVWLRLI